MKTKLQKMGCLVLLVSLSLFYSCKQDKVKSFIPGTYVNQQSGEYSTVSDTLVITEIGDHSYQISQRLVIQRVLHGRALLPQSKSSSWQAVYDEGTQSLEESKALGRVTFQPDKHTLMVEQAVYAKTSQP